MRVALAPLLAIRRIRAALAAGRARERRAAKAPSQVEPAMRLVTAPTATAILARLQVRVRRRDLVRFQVRSLAQDLFPAPVRLLALAPFRLRVAHLRRALLS